MSSGLIHAAHLTSPATLATWRRVVAGAHMAVAGLHRRCLQHTAHCLRGPHMSVTPQRLHLFGRGFHRKPEHSREREREAGGTCFSSSSRLVSSPSLFRVGLAHSLSTPPLPPTPPRRCAAGPRRGRHRRRRRRRSGGPRSGRSEASQPSRRPSRGPATLQSW